MGDRMTTLADLERAADVVRQTGNDLGYSVGACLREQAYVIASYVKAKRVQKAGYNATQYAKKENSDG